MIKTKPRNSAPRPSPDGPEIRRVQLYSTLEPGDKALALPLLWNVETEDWEWWHDLTKAFYVHDPGFICCGFREERLWVMRRGHAQRWEVLHPHGLRRKATITGSLLVNDTTTASIEQLQSDASTEVLAIDLYGWQVANSTTITGGRAEVFFDPNDRQWWTGAYRR